MAAVELVKLRLVVAGSYYFFFLPLQLQLRDDMLAKDTVKPRDAVGKISPAFPLAAHMPAMVWLLAGVPASASWWAEGYPRHSPATLTQLL
jgi:hypothetical protein